MSIPYHNPKNVETAEDGWRFCLQDEILHPPKDAQFHSITRTWFYREYYGTQDDSLNPDYTYRTRTPLPEPYIYEDEAYRRGVEEAEKRREKIMRSLPSPLIPDWTEDRGGQFYWDSFIYKIADAPKKWDERDWSEFPDVHKPGHEPKEEVGKGICEHEFHYSERCSLCADEVLSETKPKIILDWSKLPKEATHIFIIHAGNCKWSTVPVILREGRFWNFTAPGECGEVDIPFTFSGDWKESLTPRPEFWCNDCGREMKLNVPRLGPSGGFVHIETSQTGCGEKSAPPQFYTTTQPRKEGDSMEECPPGVKKLNLIPDREASNPLAVGEWRCGQGFLFRGTLRIAKADFDTDPSDEFKQEVFAYIAQSCNGNNKLQSERDSLREFVKICSQCDAFISVDTKTQAKQLLDEIKP